MFHYMAVDDADLSQGHGKKLALDSLARLSMLVNHRPICRHNVSWPSVSCVVSVLK